MINSKFFSPNDYLFLPTEKKPRVALAVDDNDISKNSFLLYNPFSIKARLLKKINYFSLTKANSISKKLLNIQSKESNSSLIEHLEKRLNCSLISSIYFSTTNDKVVIQLQSIDAKILGYLKYPLSARGEANIINEKKAIEILSNNGVVERYIFSNVFDNSTYLLLKNIDGKIDYISCNALNIILSNFRRNKHYLLHEHPRIKELQIKTNSIGLKNYSKLINKICKKSDLKYELVYEHGDFAPWNILKVKKKYVPFDFEYFIENGIEFFDSIKYFYSIGKLVKNKKGRDLLLYLNKNIHLKEPKEFFSLFLINEVIRNIADKVPYNFEVELIDLLNE